MFYPPIRRPIGSDSTSSTGSLNTQERVRRAQEELDLLRGDIERLLMITEAMWSILKDQYGYQDEELVRRVTEIDKRDGRLDGRVAPAPPPVCPSCHRTLARNRTYCIYCGQAVARDPFER